MSLARSRKHWDDMGQLDPCYAILTRVEKRFGRWDLKEFFATGEQEIALLMESAASLNAPKERVRALDFGCGLGHTTTHFLDEFPAATIVGLDNSQESIERARQNYPDKRLRFVNAADGVVQKTLTTSAPGTSLAFSPDGKRLACRTGDKRAVVFSSRWWR